MQILFVSNHLLCIFLVVSGTIEENVTTFYYKKLGNVPFLFLFQTFQEPQNDDPSFNIFITKIELGSYFDPIYDNYDEIKDVPLEFFEWFHCKHHTMCSVSVSSAESVSVDGMYRFGPGLRFMDRTPVLEFGLAISTENKVVRIETEDTTIFDASVLAGSQRVATTAAAIQKLPHKKKRDRENTLNFDLVLESAFRTEQHFSVRFKRKHFPRDIDANFLQMVELEVQSHNTDQQPFVYYADLTDLFNGVQTQKSVHFRVPGLANSVAVCLSHKKGTLTLKNLVLTKQTTNSKTENSFFVWKSVVSVLLLSLLLVLGIFAFCSRKKLRFYKRFFVRPNK